MGVNANITVYGWRKPTLYLELEEGGSLLPNTKYYVVGVYGICPHTYNAVGSVPSDVYEITTTDTAKSIKITHKTWRDIQSFDPSNGKTLINCERHCFANGDTVKFNGGSYDGEHTIEWIDYNNFLIDASFIDSSTTECYSDSQRYNDPLPRTTRYTSHGLAYFVNTAYPSKMNIQRWTRNTYTTENVTNPTTITALPGKNFGLHNQIPEICGLSGGVYDSLLGYGMPFVYVSGTVTPEELQAEFIEAGFPYHCGYSIHGYGGKQFNLFAALKNYGSASMTINDTTVLLGSEFITAGYEDQFIFNNCIISNITGTMSGYISFTANNCVYYNTGNLTNTLGWIYGDNTILYNVPRQSASYSDYIIEYTNRATGTVGSIGIIENKEFRGLHDKLVLFQIAYNDNKLINTTVPPIYWIMNTDIGSDPDIYIMENTHIYYTYNWHFRFYGYDKQGLLNYRYLNINTDDPNNIKKIVHNSLINLNAEFYRRLEFYVQGDGDLLEGAEIEITDNGGNVYSGITDENGYTYIDVIEQKTVFTWDDPIISVWNGNNDTYYGDYNITFNYDGFYEETLILHNGYGFEINNISLKKIEPPVFYHQEIEASIEGALISGGIEENNLSGTVSTAEIYGEIEDEIL